MSAAQRDGARAPGHVVVAGGGVAAIETLLALRELAGDRVSTTVVAPGPTFTSTALAVAQVFARGRRSRIDLTELTDDLVCDTVAAVDPMARSVRCAGGEAIGYDHLVLAVGARARPAWRHGITLGVDPAEEALHCLIDEVERGYVTQVAFVVPAGIVWALPLYELAVMAAQQVWSMGIDHVRFALVTPEERPLGVFGRAPSEAIGSLLEGCGIEFMGSTYACVEHGRVRLDPCGTVLTGARVVSAPLLEGPDVAGVPTSAAGFVPVDPYGRVPGLAHVYAAGDATVFPVKQGGIATQQADVVAESIAAAVGVAVTPEPFRPVLRAILMTGRDPRYMQHAIAGGGGEGVVATAPLWWPPEKLVGRYLSEYVLARGAYAA